MNKKGFTLTELLAVIVILGIITSIATVSYLGIRRNIMDAEYKNTVSYIKSQSILYAKDNNIKEGETLEITNLLNNGYLELSEEDANNILEHNDFNKSGNALNDLNDKCKIYINYGSSEIENNSIEIYDYYAIFSCTTNDTANSVNKTRAALNTSYKFIAQTCKDGTYEEYHGVTLSSILKDGVSCKYYIEDNEGNKYIYD